MWGTWAVGTICLAIFQKCGTRQAFFKNQKYRILWSILYIYSILFCTYIPYYFDKFHIRANFKAQIHFQSSKTCRHLNKNQNFAASSFFYICPGSFTESTPLLDNWSQILLCLFFHRFFCWGGLVPFFFFEKLDLVKAWVKILILNH